MWSTFKFNKIKYKHLVREKLMFSRFTGKAIQAIMVAQEEAKRFNHSYVGTEHILLGIIHDQENIVVKALVSLDIEIDEIKNWLRNVLILTNWRFQPKHSIYAAGKTNIIECLG